MILERCYSNSGLILTVETLRFNVQRQRFFWLYRIQFFILLVNLVNFQFTGDQGVVGYRIFGVKVDIFYNRRIQLQYCGRINVFRQQNSWRVKLREFFFRLGQVDQGAMQKIVYINIASLQIFIIQLLVLLVKFFKNLLLGIFCRVMFMLKEFVCRRQQFRII